MEESFPLEAIVSSMMGRMTTVVYQLSHDIAVERRIEWVHNCTIENQVSGEPYYREDEEGKENFPVHLETRASAQRDGGQEKQHGNCCCSDRKVR